MAIQFQCSGCSQPIEVDDEHAGKTATCPYCQRLIAIPLSSTIEPRPAVMARALSDEPAQPIARAWLAQGARRQAISYGNYAIVCTSIMLLLCGAFIWRSVLIASRNGLLRVGETFALEDQKKYLELIQHDPFIIGPAWGALFFSLFGVVLGVASLRQAARGNWRGILSCVICGLFLLCQCGSALVMGPVFGVTDI
jgi:hypothetical protein